MPFTDTLQRPQAAAPIVGTYRLRYAATASDVRAAQKLRFQVFNLELQEGLVQSVKAGLDADEFDAVCEHLLVEDAVSGEVIGTYRMQTGTQAAQHLGFYCAREFDFAPYRVIRDEILELGRACIHMDHRNFTVLSLLWRGIASYAQKHGTRYLLGCSSLTSQNETVGAAAFRQLQPHLAAPCYRTVPQTQFVCALDVTPQATVRIPKLLSAYLALGAWICGPPAIDHEFKTIDFLTLMGCHLDKAASTALQADAL